MKHVMLFFFIMIYQLAPCQDQNWVLGDYYFSDSLAYGGVTLTFNDTMPPNITPFIARFHTYSSSACISSPSGNLRFYTNGTTLMNGITNDTMLNGNGLGKDYWNTNVDTIGVGAFQGVLILPSPKDTNEYYIFYETTVYESNTAEFVADTFFYAKVNYTIGGGNGIVTAKGMILTTHKMAIGGITACKHGNGKDWWIMKSGRNADENLLFLLTENGVQVQTAQILGSGIMMNEYSSYALFSPDGSKYIKTPDSLNRVLIYDFDRCTGTLSNCKIIPSNLVLSVSLAISPNSRFAYFNSGLSTISTTKILQVDLSVSNPVSSIRAVVDADIYPSSNSQSSLGGLALAPDGKIYISSGDGIFSIIHEPDSEGVACQVELRALNTPCFATPNIPNMPNYRLGVKRGSVCDTILSNQSPFIEGETMQLYPNPTQNEIALYLPQTFGQSVQLIFIDAMGNVAKKVTLAPDTKEYILSVNDLSTGIYQVQLQSEGIIRFSQKLVIVP